MDEDTKALLRRVLADSPSASYIPHQVYGMEGIQLTGKGGESIAFYATTPEHGDWCIDTNHGEIDRNTLSSRGQRYDHMQGVHVIEDVVEV